MMCNSGRVNSIDPWAPADPLGEALHFVRMSGASYCRSELSAPWGLTLPPMPGYMWFHAPITGEVLLESRETEEGVLLRRGDFARVPRGGGHTQRTETGARAPRILHLKREQVSARYEIQSHGGGGAAMTRIFGAGRVDHPTARPPPRPQQHAA